MQAKDIKPFKKEEEKKVNILYVIVHIVFIVCVIACISLELYIQAVVCAAITIFISPIPDFILIKLGRNSINRNIKYVVGVLGFIVFCYMIPNDVINASEQEQIDNLQEQVNTVTEEETETETDAFLSRFFYM